MRKIVLICSLFLLANIVYAQPNISSVSPLSGPIGTNVTITGNNFSSIASENAVFFGAVKGTVSSSSTNEIQVTVPAGASYAPLMVVSNGLVGYSKHPFQITFTGGGTGFNSNSFYVAADSSTGNAPYDIVSIDIDLDGRPDVISANHLDNAVYIHTNTSIGSNISFASPILLMAGSLTYAISSSDIDGDAKPDIAIVNYNDDNITVFRNTSNAGSISFAPGLNFITGNTPSDIAIVDLDKDGKQDLITANAFDNKISVFKNTGSIGAISFAPKLDITVGNFPHRLATADFDDDGKIDICVVLKFNSAFQIIRNNSTPGVMSLSADLLQNVGIQPNGIAVGDLDDDSKIDMVISHGASTSVCILKNQSTPGSYVFSNILLNQTAYASDIALADLDGNGKPDLAVSLDNGVTRVSANNSSAGSIFVSPGVNCPSTKPFHLNITDIDIDGKNDIVAGSLFSLSISVLRNRINEPVITNFMPSSAASGETVTIYGNNFSNITSVKFGDASAASFTVISSTQIKAVVGNGSTGAVTITTPVISTSRAGFTYIGPPTISSFSPQAAGPGQSVTITGNNFYQVTSVKIGGTPVSHNIISINTIKANITTASSGDIIVNTNFGADTISGFNYLAYPVVSSFSPTATAAGMPITITGYNFLNVSAITIGGAPANSFTVNSPTSITAIVGNATSGNVIVTNNFGSGTLAGFTFYRAPTISSFSPTSGIDGTIITLTGSNFDNITSVMVGSANYIYEYTRVSSTTITIPLNHWGASGDIVVQTSGGTATAQGFVFYKTPLLYKITPIIANAGVEVTLVGKNFEGTSAVTLGGVPLASITSIRPDTIKGIVGAGASGSVYVTNPAGTRVALDFIFSDAPIISSCFPIAAYAGSIITFKGGGFNAVPQQNIVYFGDVKAEVVSSSANELKVKVPIGASYKRISITNISTQLTGYWEKSFNLLFASDSTELQANFLGEAFNLPLVSPGNLITTGDMDGDGKTDIIVAYVDQPFISIFRNISSSNQFSFSDAINLSVSNKINAVIVEDFNNDGKLDILGYNNGFSTASLLISIKNISSSGNIQFEISDTISTYPSKQVITADFNNDGKIDIIASCINCSYGNGGSSFLMYILHINNSVNGNILFSSTGEIPFMSNINSGTQLRGLAVSDFNNDNNADIVAGTNSTHYMVGLNRGSGTIFIDNTQYSYGNFSNPQSYPVPADYDRDGDIDILMQNAFHRNQGGTISQSILANSLGPVGSNMDFNGDGYVDFVKNNNFQSDSLELLTNKKAASGLPFGTSLKFYGTPHFSPPLGIDIDGDNKPELLYVNRNINAVSILKNRIGAHIICPGSSAVLHSNITSGSVFQWQVDMGSGFVDIANTAIYSGTNTAILNLANVPSSYLSYKYRCRVDAVYSNIFKLKFLNSWTGAVSNAWENAANWSCGTVPDENTDVIINSGTVLINSNSTVLSLSVTNNSTVIVSPGNNLTILN